MKRWRLALYAALIFLPAVLIVSCGAWYIAVNVPRLIRYEPRRIGRSYREIAENLFDHSELATYRGERRKNWHQVGKINGYPWGYSVEGDRTWVWHQVGKRQCQAMDVEPIRPIPYAWIFYCGGTFVGVVLLGLSALAVACLVRFLRERDDFMAATAHDLTTPLVGMRMMIGRNDEEARRLNERMLLIVSNLRDFLRLGGRRNPPRLVPVDVGEACREAYQLFGDDYRDILGGDVPITVKTSRKALADATLLTQVFWNLFGNDLKYAAPYGQVQVEIGERDGRVIVDFADQGQGMTAFQRRHAFDRYYRAKTAMESGKGGFGIGLCTARELVRSMGGELTVRANSPSGCVFGLTLPGEPTLP